MLTSVTVKFLDKNLGPAQEAEKHGLHALCEDLASTDTKLDHSFLHGLPYRHHSIERVSMQRGWLARHASSAPGCNSAPPAQHGIDALAHGLQVASRLRLLLPGQLVNALLAVNLNVGTICAQWHVIR